MANAPVDGQIKVLACIGNICLQWSLLEQAGLFVISTIEKELAPKTYLKFGNLDMVPRLNMAINLARDAKVPVYLVKRLEAVRTSVRDNFQDKRNQAVHGVHSAASDPDSVTFTMVRWFEPKRTQTVSAVDLYAVATGLHALMEETLAISDAIHEWRIKVLQNRIDHAERQLAESDTPVWFKAAQDVYGRIKRLLRKK
jgi:hypothetical protein